MARNNPENVGDGILKMRAELKKLILDEEAAARHARKARIAALKARYAAIRSENLVSELPHRWSFFNKLLEKNISYWKSRAEKLETKCREADDTLKRLTDSRRALTASLAQALGVEPPANVSEQDVEEYLTKEKLQLQTISKELEEVETALKEAALEKEKKEQTLEKPEEPVAIKAKTEITDEERGRLKKADAEYMNAVEKEKSIQSAVQKKRGLIEEREKEKRVIQPVLKELEEADAALKEATLNRELIEQELQNLKNSIETSVKTELTDEEQGRLEKAKAEHHNAVEKEKSIESAVKKKKEIVGSHSEKYKPLFQFMLKELEEEEAALKEAALERERKENELNNLVAKLVESIETRVKANISEEKLECLKKTEAEYLKALEKEKSIESEVIKKKELEEKNQEKDKTVFQSLLKELEEAEAALKESALERERKEREFQNLKKALDPKAKPEFTEKKEI